MKKNSEPIFGKVIGGPPNKKNNGHISGKNNEGDKIKKLLTYLKKILMRATKNKQKNTAHLKQRKIHSGLI